MDQQPSNQPRQVVIALKQHLKQMEVKEGRTFPYTTFIETYGHGPSLSNPLRTRGKSISGSCENL
jgi:hypothetical protein